MKIQDIGNLDMNNMIFKLSDNSITARQNSKTVAVINDVRRVKGLPFRDRVDLNMKFKGKLNQIADDYFYVSSDNKFYSFISQSYYELGNKETINSIEEKIKKLNEYGVNIIFAYIN
jgi:hypothetical protein